MPKKSADKLKTRRYAYTEEVYDGKTGEVKRIIKQYTIKMKSENFYLTYIDNFCGFLNVTSNTDKSVLAMLCTMSEYNTGRVFVSASERKEMSKSLGISTQQITNAIASLKQVKLLSGERGFYMINPALYWRGTSKSRSELLQNQAIAVEFNFVLDEGGQTKATQPLVDMKPNDNFDNQID